MTHEGLTAQHRAIGRAAAWTVSLLLVTYAITTGLGFLSLQSPLEPIGDPYFTMMELLIVIMMPPMVVTMLALHAYASPEAKLYSLMALALMTVVAGITSCVHFAVLTVSRQIEAAGLTSAPLLFSFEWPSVAYTLDILAWDWFFALSMLSAAAVLKAGRLETTVKILMIVSGVLSLAGLIGVPLADMQVRNIGVVGYAVVTPFLFFLLGMVLGRAPEPVETRELQPLLSPGLQLP